MHIYIYRYRCGDLKELHCVQGHHLSAFWQIYATMSSLGRLILLDYTEVVSPETMNTKIDNLYIINLNTYTCTSV